MQFHPTVLWQDGGPRPVPADHRGAARRRRGAGRRGGRRSWPGVTRSATWPRATWCRRPCSSGWPSRRRRRGRAPVAGRHQAGPRRAGRDFPTVIAAVPGARHRPGGRADPGRARRALRVRRHPGRPGRADLGPRALRGRRGRLDRGARRQPARLQLPDRGPDHRTAHRGAAGPRDLPEPPARLPAACRPGPGANPAAAAGAGRGHVPARRGARDHDGPGRPPADAGAGPARRRRGWTWPPSRRPTCTWSRSWSPRPRWPARRAGAATGGGMRRWPRPAAGPGTPLVRADGRPAVGGRGRPGRSGGRRMTGNVDVDQAFAGRGTGSRGDRAAGARRARRGPPLRSRRHLGRDRRAGRPGGGRGRGPAARRAGGPPGRPGRARRGRPGRRRRRSRGARTGTGSARGATCCGSGPRSGNCSAPNGRCSTSSPTCRASPPPPGRGRTPSPARDAPSATPARPRRGCASWRSTPCGAAAARTTGWGSATPR